MSDHARRLQALERLYSAPPCRTCAGTGYLVVGVPENIAADDPAHLPEACPACGRPVRRVLRIVGMRDEELA